MTYTEKEDKKSVHRKPLDVVSSLRLFGRIPVELLLIKDSVLWAAQSACAEVGKSCPQHEKHTSMLQLSGI